MADTALATNGTHADPLVPQSQMLRVFTDMVQRLSLLQHGVTFQGARDLYTTLGYKRLLTWDDYLARYQRGGIAAAIVDAFPDATWRLPPTVREIGKDSETDKSPFEAAWEGLVSRLKLWQVFRRLDRLACLGHYAVLLLGLRGQTQWDAAATPVRGPDDLLYLNTYSEKNATIQSLVSSERLPTFGQPAQYYLNLNLLYDDLSGTRLSTPAQVTFSKAMPVHASRVVHVAENGLFGSLIGEPRLRRVWNYLDDLDKVLGGSGEMFWQDAKRRLVLSLAPDAQLTTEAAANLSAEVEEFVHELRNFLRVQGMEVTQLEGKIPDPSGNVDKIVSMIAGAVRIPQRKLIGNEQGQLASGQDENNFADTTLERMNLYAYPVILQGTIDRFIALNVLPPPRQGYAIDPPVLLPQPEDERAAVALKWSQAVAAYAGPGASPQDVLPLEIYLEDIMEFPKEQVQRILELLAQSRLDQHTQGATQGVL